MNMDYLEQNLKELELSIDNQPKFENFILNYNGGLTAFLENLNIKKGLLERKVDYNYYENEIINFLKDIQKYLSEDENLKKSHSYLKEQYNAVIKNIINKNIIGLKIEQAKKLSDKLLAELIELDIKISDLQNDTTIEEKEKTVKNIELSNEKSDLENKYHDTLNVIENERIIREKMQNRDFNQLIDSLLKDIEDLNSVINNLELSDVTKGIVSVIVKSYTNKFSKLQVNKIRALKEYNDLLKKSSLSQKQETVHEVEVENKPISELMKNNAESNDVEGEYTNLYVENSQGNPNVNYDDLENIRVNEEEIVEDLTSLDSLIGTNIVYTGKIILDDKASLDELTKGKTFKVASISKNANGEDMVELEGLTGKYSLLYFETEETWNNYLEQIEEYKVTSSIEKELNKIDLSINAIAGIIANSRVLKPVKKYGINTIIEKTNGISKKYIPLYKKITEVLDERKNTNQEIIEGYNPEETLIDEEEFSKEYEEIRSSLKRK